MNKHQKKCLFRTFERLVELKVPIPFSLFTDKGKLFSGVTSNKFFDCVISPVFIIKEFDRETGCAVLSVLIPIDMEGCPVDICSDDVFSLLTTKVCMTVDLNCFCGMVCLPPKLVNRFVPKVEPKC